MLSSVLLHSLLPLIQPGKSPSAWLLEWKQNELREHADSMFLVFRNDSTVKVNMLESDSVKISNEEGVQRVNIYKYGGCAAPRSPKKPVKSH